MKRWAAPALFLALHGCSAVTDFDTDFFDEADGDADSDADSDSDSDADSDSDSDSDADSDSDSDSDSDADADADTEVWCANGIDDEGDGFVDCDDFDCESDPACTVQCQSDADCPAGEQCSDGRCGAPR